MRKDIGLGKRRKPIEKKTLGLLLPPLLISGVDILILEKVIRQENEEA